MRNESTGWFRWRQQYADDVAYADIAEAIKRFRPVAKKGEKAGSDSALWLMEYSADDYPSTATWLFYRDQKVHAFFSICSGNVQLHDDGQSRFFRRLISGLPGRRYAGLLEPASEIRWFGRHIESDVTGKEVLEQATLIATEVAEIQGNIALVIDPYDDATAEMLLKQYKFLRSAKHGQLWLPLQRQEEIVPSTKDE
jgi:hypothetical protein